MSNRHISLTLLFFCLFAGSKLSARASDPLEEALAYASRPPSQRERSQAVEKLLQAGALSEKPNDIAAIYQRIARMYWQSFNPNHENSDLPAAISYCEKALAVLPEKNILAAQVQVNLAVILIQSGKSVEGMALCKEVIERPVEEVLKGEITQEIEAKLRQPKPKEAAAVARSPSLASMYYEDRLNRYKHAMAEDYFRIQESAVQVLANTQYRTGGLPALVQLEKELKSGPLRAIVRKLIAEKTKPMS